MLRLLDEALSVWEQHYSPGTRLTYKESVTGSLQELDVALPREAKEAIYSRSEAREIQERYREPIAALQDGDLDFPGPAAFAYYAIYNAYRRYVENSPIEESLIANQAMSALPEEQVENAFKAAVQNAG